jgi:hypothetical protein
MIIDHLSRALWADRAPTIDHIHVVLMPRFSLMDGLLGDGGASIGHRPRAGHDWTMICVNDMTLSLSLNSCMHLQLIIIISYNKSIVQSTIKGWWFNNPIKFSSGWGMY